MEFNFNINHYFKNEITIVGSRLIPDGFLGDRREIQECISRVSYVLSVLGENSAKAQGLQRVITSGEKLRITDHIVYILIDPLGGKRGTGSVLGMLKMGMKHLYVFDRMGNNHEVTARCVLDFYVHESKQRMGLGKKLFQYMLKEENIEPQHLAIDKPSPKFLSFLRKHYDLHSIIPQMNNFVVFDGFFSNKQTGGTGVDKKVFGAGVSSSTSNYASGRISQYTTPISSSQMQQSNSSINVNQSVSFGRPALHRPVSTMGLILQHKTSANPPQPFQPGSMNDDGKVDDNSNRISDNETTNQVEEENIHITATPDPKVVNIQAEEEKPSENKCEKNSSVEETTFESVLPSVEPNGNVSPMGCNAQASKPQHLDLKFYHSSLWENK